MSWVLKDFLRRWWWAIGLTVVGQMALAEPSSGSQRMAPLLALFAGHIPLMFDTSRGYMRVLVQLPMRRQELAAKCWLLIVVFPAVLTFVASLTIQTLSAFFQSKAFAGPLSPVVHGLSAFLICGTMFAAFSGKTSNQGEHTSRLLTGLNTLILLFTIGSPFMLMRSESNENWMIVMAGFASMATWIGWRNREFLIAGSAQPQTAYLNHLATLVPRTQPRAPVGAGGWSYLIRSTAHAYANCVVMMFVMMIVLAYLFSFIGKAVKVFQLGENPVEQFLSAENGYTLGVWLVAMAVSLRTVVQPRVWRMLPVRTGVLTGMMMGLPLLFSFITMWLFFGVNWLVTDAVNLEPSWSRAAQFALFFIITVPVVLRWGMTTGALVTLTFVFMIFAAIAASMPQSALSQVSALALIVVTPVCSWLTHRLLTRSSAPYRSVSFRFSFMPQAH